ncbi:D-alanine--D-alanine ligase [Compostibacter hankyongensis]|uniref:D-alanine--D-alanine ligase n=1 Tax=Compostibacter hankyongensis TaxID=1007089 RepID=A0ABP8G438_9BACT
MKKNIALVAGGYSGEYGISMQSAVTIEKHIDKERYDVYKIEITRAAWQHITDKGEVVQVDRNDFSLTLNGRKVTFDAVFIGIHGTPGEDGRLQGYFDMLGIPYTSCGSVTSALTFNKSYCNKVVAALGVVNISPSVHLFRNQPYAIADILRQVELPCFVKPNEGGSSVGMSRVTTVDDLEPALEKAFREDSQVLVEQFVPGREFSCGLFKTQGIFTVLPITEIISTRDFFDYEAKYTPGLAQEVTPAEAAESLQQRIRQTACSLYNALNCRGITRIDFIWKEETDELFFLEINTMPGQSDGSIVPKQVRAAGMTLKDFYGSLLEACFE